jgi:hypothetical protein
MSEKTLRKRLKRLFSTAVVVRNVGGTKLKVADTSHMQAFTSRTLYDRYSRIHSTQFSPHTLGMSRGEHGIVYQGARLQLFRDYDIMDSDAIVASALDIYADETTVKSEYGESLIVESPNENIREIIHNLFYDILNIEFNLWPWIRNMCKYGDFFLFLEITEKYGIVNVLPLSVYDTIRVEGENPQNPYEVYFQTLGIATAKDRFENFEIAHFRLLADSNFLPYGKAMIEPARRTWKQLVLMEDAMLVHRLVRAPDRRVFKVDIGNIPPNEVDTFMERLMSRMQKTPLIDPNTGEYNLRFNLMNIVEDFYLPVRGGDSGTDIANLSGLTWNATDDVEYLRNKMIGSLKVPRAFLGYEEMIGAKATLAAEDIRFARTIERIQRIVISELTKIAIVHLYAQGFTDEELVNFSLNLANPSTIYEQEKIALWREKVGLAAELQGINLVGSDWIYEHVLGMSEDEVEDQRIEVVKDKKRLFRLMSIEQGSDPAAAGGTETPPGESVAGEEGGEEEGPPEGEVDLSGLPTAEEGVDLEEKAGRPPEGDNYESDRHPFGRDPVGRKEIEKGLHRDPEGKQKVRRRGFKPDRQKSLAREALDTKEFVKSLAEKFGKGRQILQEGQEDSKDMLDESNIDDLERDLNGEK